MPGSSAAESTSSSGSDSCSRVHSPVGDPLVEVVFENGTQIASSCSTDSGETAPVVAEDDSSSVQASPGGEASREGSSAVIIASRAYQLEMLDQSLKRNVIVAMDTGSGKTQVAVLRIKAELEKGDSRIVWFLAPTVSLCAQQHEVIKLQIPAAKMRLLTSQNNVDTWDESIWEVILDGVNIVVSTYQVLLDALNHAFVSMRQLSLLIFDEAHNCIGKNPGQKVMEDHYKTSKLAGRSVPAILGLTATPSIRSSVLDLEKLEVSMDAKCVSPTIHRDELLKCVKRPKLKYLTYTPPDTSATPTMRSLHQVARGMDIREDPYILSLQKSPTERNRRELVRAITKNDTYSQTQVQGLCTRSLEICRQLGPWAADFYISEVIESLLRRVDGGDEFFDKFINEEKRYLARTLRQVAVEVPPSAPQGSEDVSHKVTLLVEELLSTADSSSSVVGIVFVQERAMVAMLSELLQSMPPIRERYRIGTMVGTSNFSGRRKVLYDFSDKADLKALEGFKSGELNLLIATSVLEEGIDVRACNLVVCFDSPATPKSFIQRRGRARMSDSQLVLFVESKARLVSNWESLEEEMKQLYEDQEREINRLAQIERSEDTGDMSFVVPASGARLDFDNAKAHLEHFCRILSSSREFVDSRPDYIIHRHTEGYRAAILSATVVLPPFVPANLRRIESSSHWLSEKNATKDAAFQAYVALYKAGLVNDHLLPLKLEGPSEIEGRAAEAKVEPQLDPWRSAARAWTDPADKWRYSLSCVDGSNGQPMGDYEIILPVWLNRPQPITMFLDRTSQWEVRIGEGRPLPHLDVAALPDHTSTLLALPFAHRWPVDQERSHVIRVFSPMTALSTDQIGAGAFDAESEDIKQGRFLVRSAELNFTPFLYQNLLPAKPAYSDVRNVRYHYETAPSDVPYLAVKRWAKRTDFLHPVSSDPSKSLVSTKRYASVLPLPWATVDTVPVMYTQFGMMIPCLMHKIEVMLVAKELAETLLKPVGISNLDLVREAICAPGAGEPVDYERLEFLGDSILKFCTSIQALSQNPDYPEGYLSQFRDRLVANSRLSRATIEKGLAKFIITRSFTGHNWRPLYLDTYLPGSSSSSSSSSGGGGGDLGPDTGRNLSTKTLADVVEALIGASYVDGHIPKALKCISVFLGDDDFDCNSRHVLHGHETLFDLAPADDALPAVLAPLEQLIGYTFRKKALLIEAVTHGSYVADSGTRSYERLEFLGDAVLDYIIVSRVYASHSSLPHYQMHFLKSAMVNGDFIAFMAMEHGLRVKEPVVVTDAETRKHRIEAGETWMYLWKFMRHASTSIGLEQKDTAERHERMRESIVKAMQNGSYYPWDLLARLRSKKFYSDLFEAVLGAVWIDAAGDMRVCEAVVERFGILRYLERILRDGVNCLHPKDRLGRLAGSQRVVYRVDLIEKKEGGDGRGTGELEFTCEVVVGERSVVTVGDGMSREEVQTKAAQAAVDILTLERGEV